MNITYLAEKAWQEVETRFKYLEEICERNFIRIIDAFRAEQVSAHHFNATAGYGYDDGGRDCLERLYARVFGGEAALIRQQIISGTHAIALALFALLLPGDELLYAGMPYDTLRGVIGIDKVYPGSLKEMNISFRAAEIDFERPDAKPLLNAISSKTRVLALQRSRGYSWRKALSTESIERIIKEVKAAYPHIIVFVDNCYGEMVESREPCHAGADLCAGSLIKNMGAGLAPGGGYIVGSKQLIERVSCRFSFPGAGAEIGPSLISNKVFYQALFMAPQIVKEALAGSIFAAEMLGALGFEISPSAAETRHDIILALRMKSRKQLISFCRGIQKYSPVDSQVKPIPAPMPGYENEIIMACGAFVPGSTIELSADAPLREPYTLYFQGGLDRYHVKYALTQTLKDMREEGLL
jgi:cystathionine beta-lyase family protein involved in aluminum resistance